MADITFECPECKQHLVIDAGNAGQQLQCPICTKKIAVPDKPNRKFRKLVLIVAAASISLAGGSLWVIKNKPVMQENTSESQYVGSDKADTDSASESIAIDLIAATVNGTPIQNLTIDSITDLFGRPSETVAADGAGGSKKTYICYDDVGLEFDFVDYKTNCVCVDVYLTDAWDDRLSNKFNAYNGKLTRNVDSSWKSKKVLETFSDYKAEDVFDVNRATREADADALKAGQEQWIEIQKKLYPYDTRIKEKTEKENADSILKAEKADSTIRADLGTHELFFDYDQTTKFIDKVRCQIVQ